MPHRFPWAIATVLIATLGTVPAQGVYGTEPPTVANLLSPWLALNGQPSLGTTSTSFELSNGPAFGTAYVAVSALPAQASFGVAPLLIDLSALQSITPISMDINGRAILPYPIPFTSAAAGALGFAQAAWMDPASSNPGGWVTTNGVLSELQLAPLAFLHLAGALGSPNVNEVRLVDTVARTVVYAGPAGVPVSPGGHGHAVWARGGKDLFLVLGDLTTIVRADGDVTPLVFNVFDNSTVNDAVVDLEYSPWDRLLYAVRSLDLVAFDVDPASPTYGTIVGSSGLLGYNGAPQSGRIDPSGKRLAVVDQSGTPTLWIFDTDRSSPTWMQPITAVPIPSVGLVNQVRWCAGGHQAIVGMNIGTPGGLYIFDVSANAFVDVMDCNVIPGVGTFFDWDLSVDGRVLIVRGGPAIRRVTPLDPRSYIVRSVQPLPVSNVLGSHSVFIDPKGDQILLLDEAANIFGGNPSLRYIDIDTGADLAPATLFAVTNVSQFATR